MLDIGTGLRFWGDTFAAAATVDANVLVTHLHWDHIQGLPFFTPGHRAGSKLHIFGPRQDDGRSLRDAVNSFLCPPYFPVGLGDLAGSFTFEELGEESRRVDEFDVTSRFVAHIGPTLGYRIAAAGGSLAYVSDHQQPTLDVTAVDRSVLELVAGVDVLVHDAQFTPSQFSLKRDWGHCTIDYAIEMAAAARVGTLVLFHHDPSHDDDALDALGAAASERAAARGVGRLVVAREGLVLDVAAARCD